MIKTALILVPHPDDEINLAGGLFDTLYRKGVHTTVVVCTNGDYYPEDAAQRFSEMQAAQRIFRYQDLIFLGYGDGYKGKPIYDATDDEAVESRSGRRETYCAGDVPEYCFAKTGKHRPYTRASYRQDLLDVLRERRADLLLCVDMDSHEEHRCVSRLFDECMGELLKSDDSYRPIILKGFAYYGAMFGTADFFDREIKPAFVLECFPYAWDDRVRIKNSDNTLTLCLPRNPIYRALLAHRSQSDSSKTGFCALNRFQAIANPDSCYWYRSPDNLALHATVAATSGEARYLNDFMLAGQQGWTPAAEDTKPTVSVQFAKAEQISEVVLYQNVDSRFAGITVRTDRGYAQEFQVPQENVVRLRLPSVIAERLELQFEGLGDRFTVNELECYAEEPEFPWDETPFERYEDRVVKRNALATAFVKACFKLRVRLLRLRSR